jgi:V-type H+-transporting ATPase subunit a
MGDMCRSADMVYLQVLVPQEAAENFAHEICTQDLMMFTDLNENVQMFQRDYIKDITRINETERALRQIQSFFVEYGALREEDLELTLNDMQTAREENLDLFQLADDIQKFYKNLKTQVVSSRTLVFQSEHLQDQLEVLNSLDQFLADAPQFRPNIAGTDQMGVPLVNQHESKDVGFKFLAGVCPLVKVATLRKQIFHITRGNRYFRSETLEGGQKAAFVVFFIGDYARNMIKKFCDWMDVKVFMDSSESMDEENMKNEVRQKIQDHQHLLTQTNNELKRTMDSRRKDVRKWRIQLKQEMAMRVLLNKFKLRKNMGLLRAEGWVAAANKETIESCLQRSQVEQQKAGMVEEIRGKGIKPTYFETNSFTGIFQVLIDTYGVPRNGEFNPAVPSIVTFPFLFAMMYGDIFHGSFLFLGGCWLVMNEKANGESRNEFIQNIHSGRYLIFLMGLFAIYNGLVYNDCTSISINGFNGSQWEDVRIPVSQRPDGTWPCEEGKNYCDVENGKASGVYGFGIDPIWAISTVQLAYGNSLKMKLSVIVGITQMTFGLFLKLSNHIHEGDMLSIFGEFIPQLIFMVCFFNYMQFIIILKWCKDWTGKPCPGLITLLVDMVLHPGFITEENKLFEDKDLQASVQVFMLICMFISVPWMLLMKPLVLRQRIKAREAMQGHDEQNLVDSHEHESHGGHGHEDEGFGGIMIEQVIHTIEYVLGTVSNTASYLRLWALSLAHAQLAEVFYEKTILTGMKAGNGFMVFITCGMFFGMTVAVLLMMDVLECFLHALRLHWVEFQNKFYYADGVPFLPYSYVNYLGD